MKTLKEVIENKALITCNIKEIIKHKYHNRRTSSIEFTTQVNFKNKLVKINNKKLYQILKPFIYYILALLLLKKINRHNCLLVDYFQGSEF